MLEIIQFSANDERVKIRCRRLDERRRRNGYFAEWTADTSIKLSSRFSRTPILPLPLPETFGLSLFVSEFGTFIDHIVRVTSDLCRFIRSFCAIESLVGTQLASLCPHWPASTVATIVRSPYSEHTKNTWYILFAIAAKKRNRDNWIFQTYFRLSNNEISIIGRIESIVRRSHRVWATNNNQKLPHPLCWPHVASTTMAKNQ